MLVIQDPQCLHGRFIVVKRLSHPHQDDVEANVEHLKLTCKYADLSGDLARRQGAPLFELRAALDDYDLRGAPARAALTDAASRIPANSPLPELVRARAILDRVAHGFE